MDQPPTSLRERCVQAIVERSQHIGRPLTLAQARLAYDVINEILAEVGQPNPSTP